MSTLENSNDLNCKIFLETDLPRDEVARRLSESLPVRAESSSPTYLINTEAGELELRRNEEWDASSARHFPDGFLHFRYVLEFYPSPGAREQAEQELVSNLLTHFWSHGIPAVASCDYEDRLPSRGGYKDPSLPWPSDSPEEESVKPLPQPSQGDGLSRRITPYHEQLEAISKQLGQSRRRAAFADSSQNESEANRLASLADQYQALTRSSYVNIQINNPSPVAWFVPALASSPFSGAPERAKELDILCKDLSIELKFVDDPREVSSVDLVTREITFGLGFAERMWMYAYSYFEAFKLWQKNGPGSIIDLPPTISRFLTLAYQAEKAGQTLNWPSDLPKPHPTDPPSSPSYAATELSLVIASFVLLHEIGHIALGHKEDDLPSKYVEQEYEADDWASQWLLSKWRDFGSGNDINVFIKRSFGGTISLGHLFGLESHHRKRRGLTHPDPPVRLLHFLEKYVPESTGPKAEVGELAWYMATIIVNCHMDAAGKSIPSREFPDARGYLVEAHKVLGEPR